METVLLHKSAFLYVTSIFRLSSFVFANALLTGITKTFVPFYSSFPEILYKAVKNSCLNTIRHQGVKDRYAEVALHEEELESFWDHILETELFELLLGVFNELPPACREVYHLSLEGKKHEEIAEILQITVNTVKKHKNNANHYMRERLKHILSLLVLCQFP